MSFRPVYDSRLFCGPHRKPDAEEIENLIAHLHDNWRSPALLLCNPTEQSTAGETDFIVSGHSGLYTLHYSHNYGSQNISYKELTKILESYGGTITPYD